MTHAIAARAFTVLLLTALPLAAQWNLRSPATSPTPRTGAAMDFVPQNAGLVLFGGSSPLNNNQTWLYDGVDWTLLAPAASPTARSGAELVYDVWRGVAVLYGGLASNISVPPPVSETWEWDGATWTLAAPAANAGPRHRYGACFDLSRGRVVVYGGATTQLLGIPNAETWEYDGTTWTQVVTTGSPGPRERPAMCYHAGIGRAVLFGGADGFGVGDQTWLYDGASATWTQVATTGSRPPARSAAKMVYDAARDLCVLTGGQDLAGPLGDTWTFDGVAWTQQPTATQAVRDHAFAFLQTTNQAVKFGGFAAAPNTLSNQTWELGSGVFGAGCAGSAGTPALSAQAAPIAGQSWTLDLTGMDPTFSLGFLVLGLNRLPGIDLGPLLGMPGCAAFATPDFVAALSGAAGAASWTWPTVPAVVGAPFYAQALCFDPTVNAFGHVMSNAVYGTIGQ